MLEDKAKEPVETAENNGNEAAPVVVACKENAAATSDKKSLHLAARFSFLFFLVGIPVSYYFQSGLVRLVCLFSITRYIRLIFREFFNLPDSLSGPILPTFCVVVLVSAIIGEIVGKILERIIKYVRGE